MAVHADPTLAATEHESWQRVLERLSEWKANPGMVADPEEGIPAPDASTFDLAIQLANMLQKMEYTAPTCPSVDGEGGVTLEWHKGSVHRTIEIQADHRIEEFTFDDSKFVSRRVILTPDELR